MTKKSADDDTLKKTDQKKETGISDREEFAEDLAEDDLEKYNADNDCDNKKMATRRKIDLYFEEKKLRDQLSDFNFDFEDD